MGAGKEQDPCLHKPIVEMDAKNEKAREAALPADLTVLALPTIYTAFRCSLSVSS